MLFTFLMFEPSESAWITIKDYIQKKNNSGKTYLGMDKPKYIYLSGRWRQIFR